MTTFLKNASQQRRGSVDLNPRRDEVQTNLDVVRAKIDELRLGGTPLDREQVISALTQSAISGLVNPLVDMEGPGDALHMCPYNTGCGNSHQPPTRIG